MILYYIMLLFRAKLQILCVEKKRGYSMKICNFFSIKFRYCEEEEKKINNIKLLYFHTSELVCINNKHIKIGNKRVLFGRGGGILLFTS